MRDFKPLGVQVIAHGIREVNKTQGDDALLAVSEDGENVRRSRPLEPNTTIWERSAYVKGFGEGDKESNVQELIEEYFKQFGKINAVRKRRGDLPVPKGKPAAAGKGKGEFKGSVFIEFAYEADLKKFIALEEIPKFGDEEMLKMTKDAYVRMKAKEKGIDESEIQKGGSGKPRVGNKFNAFREMAKANAGGSMQLAKIPATVDVVGTPATNTRNSSKRHREDDGEERASKIKKDEPLTIEYKGVTLEVDTTTGKVLDPSKIPFEAGSAIKFSAPGDGADWKLLKQAVTDAGLTSPFMAFPPGTKAGQVSKYEGAAVTDAEFAQIQAANITYGGQPVTFERMNDDETREFWTVRANFQGGVAVKQRAAGGSDKPRFGGGRGGGRGGRGRGGARGRGGQRGRGGNRDRGSRDTGASSGLPPTVGAVKSE